ncbi:cysteine-rich CWC family protein [Undibacterium crateris]|uniref:cysteine-rich CWC family protein n=1 Tax=Undibacterium crateris TaxID=2528175 RepID=UPI00138944BC|nr:cysteine-rich CWC family protein [Undibacterium crateris]NDI84863.1 hypothetical protein [Undibacterium crateris]
MSQCARCAEPFTCAMADRTGQDCWCVSLPAIDTDSLQILAARGLSSCLCPRCLPQVLQELKEQQEMQQGQKAQAEKTQTD